MVSVLSESRAMNANTPDRDGHHLLRTLFELGETGLRPTEDLLMRLQGLRKVRLDAVLRDLRGRGFVQPDRLNLTMAGLLIATRLPESELQPMAQPSVRTPPTGVSELQEFTPCPSSRRPPTAVRRRRTTSRPRRFAY